MPLPSADPPTSNASSSTDSPSTADTSPSAGAPPASDTPPGARPPFIGNASSRADSPSGDDAPPGRKTTPGAKSPLIGDASPGADHLSGCDTPSSTGTPLISNSFPSADSPSTGNTSPNANSPGADSAPIGNPIFTLGLSDLGERLIPKLQTLIEDNNSTGKLLVEDMGLTSTALVDAVQPLQSSGFNTQFEVEHRLDGAIWRLYTQPLNELQIPDLSNVETPSDDPEQYLEDLYRNLPEEPISYYVGPLSGSVAERLQSYFPSGDEVCQLGHVPGVSTLYGHVGEEASGTAFHCEDANLRSYNLTLVGWKIWILIRLHHTAHFEDLVRRLTECGDGCDQFVRHTSNIEFDIICSGPGDMVLTQPRQYHAVINRTASFAIATNFVLPNEDPIPKTLSLCPDDGLYHLEHRMIRKLGHAKRKGYASQLEAPPRRKRPKLHKPLELSVAEVLAHETTNRDAILRFMAVVRAWREVEKCNNRTQALDTLRMAFRENSQLFSFLEILASVHLVRNLERRITVIAPEAIDSLLEIRGLPHTEQSRRSIRNELTAYQKWDQLCGATSAYTYEGILCFAPPVFRDYREVTRKQVQHLTRDDIALFRSKLQEVEHVQRLCEAGRAFQMGIFGSAEFTERPFEARQRNLSELDLEDLLQLL
ncbi:uncharacterized protein B0I36DRAFT_377781 [Microdochium trichocladiopsis]|uniref:JmjC domain-containing protein n=1 Tax=Microdochium trichocladiopsis TaxID=1682393 RepID=A0A9P9BIV7_9PEZI|nr:uncharacterized protein B0I36DRAFT_377781 [Microdochium trichocladiopsis]KAH7016073.1 hypothetical protein B0I36DRAFT_377781 [Microdochium trichocladiopsis]